MNARTFILSVIVGLLVAAPITFGLLRIAGQMPSGAPETEVPGQYQLVVVDERPWLLDTRFGEAWVREEVDSQAVWYPVVLGVNDSERHVRAARAASKAKGGNPQ